MNRDPLTANGSGWELTDPANGSFIRPEPKPQSITGALLIWRLPDLLPVTALHSFHYIRSTTGL